MSQARVAATASLGMKVSLQGKAGFSQYDNASPHHSISIERNYDGDLSDQELVEKASHLHKLARDLVEKKINADIKELKG